MKFTTGLLACHLLFVAACSGGSGSSSNSESAQAPDTPTDSAPPATNQPAPTSPPTDSPPAASDQNDDPNDTVVTAPISNEPDPQDNNGSDIPAPPLEETVPDDTESVAQTSAATGDVSADNYLPFAYDDASFSKTIYVDAAAGRNGNGSPAQPFSTIGAALANVQPGTKVIVNAGTYPPLGWRNNLRGTEANPIMIQAVGDVVVDAQGSGVGGQFVAPQYLIVDGLTLQNTERHGLNIDDGSNENTPANHLVLKNLKFQAIGNGTNSDCLKASGVQDSLITNSEFTSCNRGEGIDFVGGHNVVVYGNNFHDTVGTGLQIKGGSSNILVRANRFADVPGRSINAGGNTDNHLFRPVGAPAEATDIQLEANVFIRSGNTPVAFTGCQDCRFVNNTIIDPTRYVARILYENTTKAESSENLYANNLILFNRSQLNGGTFVNVADNTTPNTFHMRNNLFYALDDASFAALPVTNRIPLPQGTVIQQPHGLLDWVGGNYHLSANSNAIGAGADTSHNPTHDYDGIGYQAPISIGAFSAP